MKVSCFPSRAYAYIIHGQGIVPLDKGLLQREQVSLQRKKTKPCRSDANAAFLCPSC